MKVNVHFKKFSHCFVLFAKKRDKEMSKRDSYAVSLMNLGIFPTILESKSLKRKPGQIKPKQSTGLYITSGVVRKNVVVFFPQFR